MLQVLFHFGGLEKRLAVWADATGRCPQRVVLHAKVFENEGLWFELQNGIILMLLPRGVQHTLHHETPPIAMGMFY